MRNIWIAILGVISITLFTGTAMATAPVAQDLPDFKVLTGSPAVDDFNLDEYVTDFDNTPASLTWAIQGNSGFTSAPTTSLTGHLLDIGGSSTVQQGTVTLRVSDSTAHSDTDAVVKFSSLMITGPSLTQDNNLVTSQAFPRTWVIESDQTSTTPVLKTLITPAGSQDTANITVSIADMGGTWRAGDNATSALYQELQASIDGGGHLVLAAPAGTYPRTGLTELSGAYRVGVKAKLTGGAGANWDGMELLASHSRYPVRDNANTFANLNKFNNFEGLALGTLPTGHTALGTPESADNVWAILGTPVGTSTARVVDIATALPGAPTWAASGNALELTVDSGGFVFVASQWFTDIAPGETVTVAANVACNAAAGAKVGNLFMFMGNQHIPANDYGVELQQGTAGAAADMPLNGAWRRVKTTFTADTVGAHVADGGSFVNFYQRGYQLCIMLQGVGADVYPYKVYVDNVRVYRDKQDIGKALGSTVTHPTLAISGSLGSTLFDGTFEGATKLTLDATQDSTSQNWGVNAAAAAGTAVINTASLNNVGTHSGTKSLEIYVPGGSTRTVTQGEFVYTKLNLQNATVGSVDYSGAGVYSMTAWYKTDAAAEKNVPAVLVAPSDNFFTNLSWANCGYVGAPLAGAGWKQITLTSARMNAVRLWPFIVVSADATWVTSAPLKAYWGSFATLGTNPGYEANAHVFFDDVQIRKVQDDAKYFDRSVFPVTD